MGACVSPSVYNIEETIGTLEFASRCKLIKTNAKKNEQAKGDLIEALMNEKKAIEKELEDRRRHQEQLERELMQAKSGQEEADSIQKEKAELERMLAELQAQPQPVANAVDSDEYAQLQQEHEARNKELEQVREDQEAQKKLREQVEKE